MVQSSFALMTNLGRAKEAAALANATTIEITHIAIGEGVTVPSGGETALYDEVDRKTISGTGTVVGASNVAYFDAFLAADDGPYAITEAGLIDVDGDLIAIAHYDPAINKPVPASGQTVEGTVRLEVAFSDIANVTIVVDPAMQVALQRLTRLPWVPVISMTLATPPVSPSIGDTYLVAAAPTGSWAGHAGKIAEYTAAGWAIMTSPEGHGISLPDGRIFEKVSGVYVEKIAADAQSGKWHYCVAGGTANALTATLIPVPAAYAAGMIVRAKISARNTGAATLNVNGLGVKSIKRSDGAALNIGDLVSGSIATLVYDGVNFQLVSSGVSDASVPKRAVITFTAPGTTNWTVPAGVSRVFVEGWGGGGGGGGTDIANRKYPPYPGGSGAYFAGWFDVTPGSVVPVTVGAGGAGTVVGVASSSAGGTTSFGALASATGGSPGANANSTAPATPTGGVAAGGQINLPGRAHILNYRAITNGYLGGHGSAAPRGGNGGNSYNGGGGAGQIPGGGGGAGGSGSGNDTTDGTGPANGASGGAGLLLITW